jgi:tetratricopeptide (TPR) repeat protein
MNPQGLAAAPIKTRLLATCFLHLGQVKDAEAVISDSNPEAGRHQFSQLFQGVVRAQAGQIDQAVQAFLAFLQDHPHEAMVRETAVTLLHRQAVQSINARDWAAAETAVERLRALDSHYPGLKALLEVMEMALPTMALKANRRGEAVQVWQEQQQKNPGNGRVSHSLALLYYYEALSLAGNEDNQGQAPETDAWRRAMANWALVYDDQNFWSEWRREREKIYRITDIDLATLKKNWGEELARTFRRLRTQMESQGRLDLRDQYQELECREWLERLTAATIHELQKINCPHCHKPTVLVPGPSGEWECQHPACNRPIPDWQPPHSLPACGPLMLKQLGLEQQAQELAQTASHLPLGEVLSGDLESLNLPFLKSNAEVLVHCLSPWNLGLAYLAHRVFDAALTQLEKIDGQHPETRVLLLFAILERSKQLISQVPPLPRGADDAQVREYLAPIQEALEQGRTGWRYRSADDTLASQLEELIEGLSVRAGNELKQASEPFAAKKEWSKEINLLTKGINILKLASQITPRQRTMETLARLYAERGLSHLQTDSLDQSITDYEEALRINPGDANIKTQAAQAFNVRGCKRNGRAAVRDFDRAVELDGSRALYYRNRGIENANMGQKIEAFMDLKRACDMEPGNQKYREELMRVMG